MKTYTGQDTKKEREKMQKNSVAVIIPCLNEEKTIASVVTAYKEALPEAEVYVYDNESTDNTVREALNAGAKIRYCQIPGKGAVLRQAFKEMNADICVLTDGDGTYPPEKVPEMIELCVKNPWSIVIGNRKKASDHKVMSLSHIMGNKFLRILFSILYGFKNIDILSGSRVLTRDFVTTFPAEYDGFETETEMAIHAWKKGFKVLSVDIPYLERPKGSESKVNTIKDGIKIIKLALKGKKEKEC